jgi:putative CRISPR-associated protein (TIGR02620 family)
VVPNRARDYRRHDVVLTHAEAGNVEGKHVIGVLPLRLASLAASITEIPLDIPAELRGQELTIEQVRQYAGEPVRYFVRTEGATVAHAVSTANAMDNITGNNEGR